jgi:hypothetical protein
VLAFVCVGHAGMPTLNNRSTEWKNNLVIAVTDATKAAGAIQAIPVADRVAFAANVLAVLQAKRSLMLDKTAWAAQFAATAVALVTGAGEANRQAVLTTVAAAIGNACATGNSQELTKGDLNLLAVLTQGVMSQLPSEDHVAFTTAMLMDINTQMTPDDATHKLAVRVTSNGLVAGADNAQAVLAVVVKLGIPPPPPPPSSPLPPKPPTLPHRPSGYQNQGLD